MSECEYDSAPVGPSMSWPSTARQRSVADTIRFQAKRHPHKIALLYEGNADTYKTLNCNIDRAANALRIKGILRGDRVAFLSHNNRSFVILRYAVMRLGAVFTPINFMLNPDEVAYILDHAGAKACIVEDSLCSIADEAISKLDFSPKFKAYIRHTMDLVPDGWIDGDALLEFEESPPVTVSIEEDAPIQLMYTSGTESRPKAYCSVPDLCFRNI